MRLALLSLNLAALLGGSVSRPPASTFFFPDELPTSSSMDGRDRAVPLTSLMPRPRLRGQARFQDHTPGAASEKLRTQVLSDIEEEMFSPSTSSEDEGAETVENIANDVLVFAQPETGGFDAAQSEFGKSDIVDAAQKRSMGQIAEAEPTTPVSEVWFGLATSVSTESQAIPGSHAGTDTRASSSEGAAVPDDSVLRPDVLPDVSSGAGDSTMEPSVSSRSLLPNTTDVSLAVGSRGSTAAAGLASSAVFFPDSASVTERAGSVQRLPSCDGKTVSALHPVTGLCQLLGVASGCPEGQMFLLSPEGTAPGCRPLPCPDGQLLVEGLCLSDDDPTVCPPRMNLVLDERGGGRCACRPGHVLWPDDQRCYPALSQGPCPVGQQLTAPWDESKPHCADNPCVLDGSFLWLHPPNIGCFKLQYPEDGCESKLMLKLREDKLFCDSFLYRGLFDPPEVRCGGGGTALMDRSGECREALVQSFRN